MRVISDKGEKTMDHNDYEAAAERGEKSGAAVDRAGKNRGQDDDEDGVERRLAREGPFVTHANHDQRREKDDDTAQRDLHKGQIFWFDSQTENWRTKIVNSIHI